MKGENLYSCCCSSCCWCCCCCCYSQLQCCCCCRSCCCGCFAPFASFGVSVSEASPDSRRIHRFGQSQSQSLSLSLWLALVSGSGNIKTCSHNSQSAKKIFFARDGHVTHTHTHTNPCTAACLVSNNCYLLYV